MGTIAQPDLVKHDDHSSDRENFYRIVAGRGTTRPVYLKVCVEYGPAGDTIITTFRTPRIKRTEETKWP